MSHIPWQAKAKTLMAEKDITQQVIADTLSVSKGTVSHWMSGRHKPSLDQMRKMARLLEVSLPELIEDDETFVRDETEMMLLRKFRESISDDDRQQAVALFSAFLDTLRSHPN